MKDIEQRVKKIVNNISNISILVYSGIGDLFKKIDGYDH